MRVIGLMSGTSADGIDVAFAQITGHGWHVQARLKHFCTFSYPTAVRRAILRIANANRQRILSVAEVSQLDSLLGELFARAVQRACRRFGIPLEKIDLVGSHGQTVYHQPTRRSFAGQHIASTLQLGQPAVIAERTGLPVVAHFRSRDLAAGGQGAPLVPYVDYLLYRHPRRGRAILNLGGIANVTVLPAGASPEDVIAFDTGPGNMVIDAVTERVTHGRARFDRNGVLASKGRPLEAFLRRLLRDAYFRREPPKSTGREKFGLAYAEQFLRHGQGAAATDKVRTATDLTARTIAGAFERFILPRVPIQEVILGGGGVRNVFLVSRLQEFLPGLTFVPAERLGINEKAKEAFAFAVLAYQTWWGEPANLPAATGARRPVLLGCVVPRGH